MMDANVVRVVAYFSRDNDQLVGEYRLFGIDLPTLQALFGGEPEDPMYDVWPVGSIEAEVLRNHVAGAIDLERYDYHLECYTSEGESGSGSDADLTEEVPRSKVLM
jgi:hypothetical protein